MYPVPYFLSLGGRGEREESPPLPTILPPPTTLPRKGRKPGNIEHTPPPPHPHLIPKQLECVQLLSTTAAAVAVLLWKIYSCYSFVTSCSCSDNNALWLLG